MTLEISGISQRCAGTGSEGTGTGSEVPGEANARMKPYDRIKKVEALIAIVHCNRDSTHQYLSYFSLHAPLDLPFILLIADVLLGNFAF
jgi:hypothetical protein